MPLARMLRTNLDVVEPLPLLYLGMCRRLGTIVSCRLSKSNRTSRSRCFGTRYESSNVMSTDVPVAARRSGDPRGVAWPAPSGAVVALPRHPVALVPGARPAQAAKIASIGGPGRPRMSDELVDLTVRENRRRGCVRIHEEGGSHPGLA
jgi:hypothetical protein